MPEALNAIQAAMNEWESKTCIRFVKRTSQRDYLWLFRQQGWEMRLMASSILFVILSHMNTNNPLWLLALSICRYFRKLPLSNLTACGRTCSYWAIFAWVSKVFRVYVGFASLRLVIGSKNSRHFFMQPIRSKTKITRGSLAHIFPRFKSAAYICVHLLPAWLDKVRDRLCLL